MDIRSFCFSRFLLLPFTRISGWIAVQTHRPRVTQHVLMILNVPRLLGSSVHATIRGDSVTTAAGGVGAAKTHTASKSGRRLNVIELGLKTSETPF